MSITTDDMPPVLFPDDWARTRVTDPITSHEAADTTDAAASQTAVLAALREYGALAQFQAEAILHGQFSPSRIRSAFSELEQQGIVVRLPDEHSIRTPRGRRAQLWDLETELRDPHAIIWRAVRDHGPLTSFDIHKRVSHLVSEEQLVNSMNLLRRRGQIVQVGVLGLRSGSTLAVWDLP
jgi:DNA-binding MarR family transcriptional regulator